MQSSLPWSSFATERHPASNALILPLPLPFRDGRHLLAERDIAVEAATPSTGKEEELEAVPGTVVTGDAVALSLSRPCACASAGASRLC